MEGEPAPQQCQSEVLDRCESAVCKRIEVRISRPEDAAVNRWAKVSRENIEYGYADLRKLQTMKSANMRNAEERLHYVHLTRFGTS
jgi:hypothetical protein